MFEKTSEGWADFVMSLKDVPGGIYTFHAKAQDSMTGKITRFRNRKFVVIKEENAERK